MRIAVRITAARSVLFIRVKHGTDCATRPQPEFFEQSHRFPRHDATPAIVMRALAHIPRIKVASDNDDFVRLLGPFNLRHHVCRLCIRQELSFHLESQRWMIAAIVHAL